MAHFTACLIFEIDPAEKEGYKNIIQKQKEQYINLLSEDLGGILDFFNMNTEVEPFKTYLKPETISEIAKYNNLDLKNTKSISEKVADWNGNRGGVDSEGIYEVSTANPDGHYDYCRIYDVDTAEGLLAKFHTIDRIPRAVILPDLTWLDGPYVYGSNEKNTELQDWEEKIKKALEMYKADGIAVFIDCHQ